MLEGFFIKKAADLITSLATHLREIQKSRKQEIVEIERIFGPIDFLVPYYVVPDGQNVNPADLEEDDTGLVARNNIFELIDKFLAGPPRYSHAFILSDAGMGKSSLLVMLKLFHLKKFIRKQCDMILLKLGPDTLEKIESIDDPGNTILLLDALDEDPEAWQHFYGRLQMLLQASKTVRKVIITCRTQFFPKEYEEDGLVPGQVNLSGFHCSKLFLSPFSNEQVEEYLDKRFEPGETKERARKIVTAMKSLKFRPMLLSYVDFLLEHKDRSYHYAYEIYEALVEEWLNREMRKGIVKAKEPLRKACAVIAVKMYSTKQRTLEYHDLREIYLSVEGLHDLDYLSIEGRSLLHKTSEGNFKFAHYSILEFFVAAELAGNPKSMENSDQVRSFLADLINHRKLKNLRGLDLSYVTIKGCNMKSGNLGETKLKGTVFEDVDLRFSNFSGATLEEASFRRAKMTGACFDGSSIKGCDFIASQLDDTIILTAELSECDLRSVDLTKAMLGKIIFRKANVSHGNFDRVRGEELDFSEARVPEGSFCGVHVQKCIFRAADLQGANFNHSRITRADFSKANLAQSNLANASLEGAEFGGANMPGVNLEGALLTGADLKRCKLSSGRLMDVLAPNIVLDHSDISGCDFKKADLGKSSLKKANAVNSDFTDCILKEANLGGLTGNGCIFVNTDLSEANLSNSSMRRANFSESNLSYCDLGGSALFEARFEYNRPKEGLKKPLKRRRLTGVILSRSKLEGAVFRAIEFVDGEFLHAELGSSKWRDVVLRGCSLESAKMQKISLEGCELRFSRLLRTNLCDATFTDCAFVDCKWTDALYNSNTVWPEGFDPRASGALGPGAVYRNRDFEELKHFNLSGADLSGADLERCKFIKRDLSRANLSRGRLSFCDFTHANLSDTNLSDANLENCDLTGANLTGAKLDGAVLRNARISRGTRFPLSFDLKGQQFRR